MTLNSSGDDSSVEIALVSTAQAKVNKTVATSPTLACLPLPS